MLNLMRKHAKSWMIKIVVAVITCVFVLWGVGTFREKSRSQIAYVNGQPIFYEEFNQVYKNLIDQLQKTFGNALDEKMLKTLQVRRQALNQVIDKKLLLMEGTKLSFSVADREVAQAITQIPAFQIAGVFDGERYRDILSRFRLTPEQFEIDQKENMLLEKVRTFITSSVKVSQQETLEWYRWGRAEVNIDFVLFEPDKYEGIQATDEEIKVFFDQNKEAYKTEPKVKVRYLRFDPNTYKAKVNITDAEIKAYYEANPKEFETPQTVEARHILIKVDPDATPALVEAAHRKAMDIHQMAKGGQDFAALARTYSEGPTKDKGGYLGTFKKEDMVEPFAEKAFGMQTGEISEPVRTTYGWHIIKVEKMNPATQKSHQAAAEQIRAKLTAQMAQNLAYDDAEEIYDQSFEGDDLGLVVEDRKLEIHTTDFFTRLGPDKGFANPSQFAAAAFGLQEMEISEIQDLGDGYYIMQLNEKIEARIPELEAVEARVRTDIIKKKQDEKAAADAKAFLSAVKTKDQFAAEGQKRGLAPIRTDFFNRTGTIPNIGYETELTQAAFSLTEQRPIPENVIKGQKGYYVICFQARKTPDLQGFEAEKDVIKKNLLEQKKLKTFQNWVTTLKKRSDIRIEEKFLDQ